MSEARAAKARQANPNKRKEIAWILYDVGNSAFTLLVSTVLPIYFNYLVTSAGLAATDATAIWGYAASAVTLCVAVLSPILGSFADDVGRKKPLFFFSAVLGVLGCGALGIPMGWIAFLAVFVVAKICYSVSLVFYDAMLTDVTTPERLDDISAKGYAFGYVGSCIPFLIGIYLINFTDLAITVSMPVACLINALWWFGFTLPLTKEYEQTHFIRRAKNTVRGSFKRLFSVFGKKTDLPNRRGIILFLIAFFLYIDGVYTVIDMATSFGTALGFDTTSLLLALLLTQIIAFPSAIVFGKLASRVHNDVLILVCVVAYTGVGIFAVFMTQGWQFWVLACVVGLFQGGVQALSRSYFAQIIPAEQSGLLFGILDIFGKGAAFIGTLLVGVVTQATGSVNMGALPIVVLFVLGLVALVFAARENRKFLFARRAQNAVASEAPSEGEDAAPGSDPSQDTHE